MLRHRLVLLTFALGLRFVSGARAQGGSDWPQWLGPAQNGAVAAPGLFKAQGEVRLRKAWSVPVEGGRSGLSVAKGVVYTMVAAGDVEAVVALAAEDGRPLWRVPIEASVSGAHLPPVSTPAVDGGLVFALGTGCVLRALEATTGRVVWQHDLKARFGVELRQGCASSPFVREGRLIVQTGGKEDHRVVALDPATGELRWSAKAQTRTYYSSPVAATLAGTAQVVVNDALPGPPPVGGLAGLSAADGKLLWRKGLDEGFSFDTPLVLSDDRIALLTWNDARLFQLKAGAAGLAAEPMWKSADLKAYVAPPVAHAGHLYGFGGDELACLETASGRTLWKEKLYPGSVALADGHLVALSVNAGLLRIVRAGPQRYEERARIQVFDRGARAETPPSLAGRRIFVRSEDEIAAVEVVE